VIGLDTNVLVRYLTQDDPEQAAVATRVIETEVSRDSPGFISLVVLVECVWVLRRLYRADVAEICEIVDGLLGSPTIVVEKRSVVARALAMTRKRAGSFPDALIAATALDAGCDRVLTFDRGAVSAGMTLLD